MERLIAANILIVQETWKWEHISLGKKEDSCYSVMQKPLAKISEDTC